MAVRLSALRTGRALLPRNIISLLLILICERLSKPQGVVRLQGSGKLKKCIHLIGTRTRDLPARSVEPQPMLLDSCRLCDLRYPIAVDPGQGQILLARS
jgi:hypothetical protein